MPIFPLNNLIEVEGAGGQTIPYLGYVAVNIHFPEIIVGKEETVSTLVLVVPDNKSNIEVPEIGRADV